MIPFKYSSEIAKILSIVLESGGSVTFDDDSDWWSKGSFCGAGNIVTLDLGVGYTDTFTLWKFMLYIIMICIFFYM